MCWLDPEPVDLPELDPNLANLSPDLQKEEAYDYFKEIIEELINDAMTRQEKLMDIAKATRDKAVKAANMLDKLEDRLKEGGV